MDDLYPALGLYLTIGLAGLLLAWILNYAIRGEKGKWPCVVYMTDYERKIGPVLIATTSNYRAAKKIEKQCYPALPDDGSQYLGICEAWHWPYVKEDFNEYTFMREETPFDRAGRNMLGEPVGDKSVNVVDLLKEAGIELHTGDYFKWESMPESDVYDDQQWKKYRENFAGVVAVEAGSYLDDVRTVVRFHDNIIIGYVRKEHVNA